MEIPHMTHLTAAKRTLRYIEDTNSLDTVIVIEEVALMTKKALLNFSLI